MSAPVSDRQEAARLWAIRVEDPAFADWDGFTSWMEENPAHASAYEAALEDASWAADLLASAPPREPTAPAPRQRWWFAGGAVAAAAAAIVGWTMFGHDSPMQHIETLPGEHRTIDLADGSRVILNGGTRIAFDPDTPRHVELAEGEALFDVKHDERKPFVVVTGNTRLVDAGTRFNVVREGGALDVSVAEGAVIYAPGPGEVRLDAGEGLTRPRDGAAPLRRSNRPEDVGSWRSGQLHYDNPAPDQVARDLSRNLGRPVRAAGGTRSIAFTGTLVLRGTPEEVIARAGPLLGVRFDADGKGWTMSPTHGPP